jgi:hypothetical protein
VGVDYGVFQKIADLVDHGQFAAAAKAGVHRQNTLAADWRLQEQAT